MVADEGIRDELFRAIDTMGRLVSHGTGGGISRQAGGDVRVGPYSLDVSTAAERTEGHAVQLRVDPDTIFIDVVTIEQGPTLMYASFVHQGELTFDDEEQILAPAVERLKDL